MRGRAFVNDDVLFPFHLVSSRSRRGDTLIVVDMKTYPSRVTETL